MQKRRKNGSYFTKIDDRHLETPSIQIKDEIGIKKLRYVDDCLVNRNCTEGNEKLSKNLEDYITEAIVWKGKWNGEDYKTDCTF